MSFWHVALAAPFAVAAVALSANPTPAPVNRNGWRSWNAFGLNVDQTLIQDVANAVAARRWTIWNGSTVSLADLGYVDVGIDDGWQLAGAGVNGGFHNAAGMPIVNTSKFPDLAGLVTAIHALGLTAGFYGNNCHGAEKDWVLKNFQGDVTFLVETGFDSYKLDSCGALKDIALYTSLLGQTPAGKNVTVENCHNGPWLPEQPYKPEASMGGWVWCPFSFYRSSLDIRVDYASIFGNNLQTVIPLAAEGLSYPGCRAYPDMLEVGVPPGLHGGEVALTFPEARAHFAAWSIVSSPLVLGLDVRNATLVAEYISVIGNSELIDINTAWAGAPGTRIAGDPSANTTFTPCGWLANCTVPAWEVWSKPLPGGSAALLFLNHGPVGSSTNVTVAWADVPGLAGSCGGAGGCSVRDVYEHESIGNFEGGWTAADLPAHDSRCIVVSPA